MGHDHQEVVVRQFNIPQKLKSLSYALIGVGVLTLAFGLLKNQERVWPAYLVAFFYFATLSIGGLFWVAVNNLSKAGWSVTVRRYAEGATAFLPVVVLGSVFLLLGMKHLFPWTRPEVLEHNPMVAAKTAYLNPTFFVIRMLIFGIGLLIFKKVIVGNSLAQDKSGDDQLTYKNIGWSIGFMPFYALGFSFFCVDLLMSLMPTWYSTIFGVYGFSGMFQSFAAFLAIVLILMRRHGYVKGYVTVEHQHDVVKYMKAFTVFWAYIAFSQFMLIWYANIPEETEYYLMRMNGGWTAISLGLLIFRFIVPFLALLPRGAKRNDNHVLLVASLILVMQFVDIYWMVYPNFFEGQLTFGFWEIGLFAGFAGLFLAILMHFYSKNSLVAIKDPRMHEALKHHVTY